MLTLTKIAETSSTITLGWSPPPDAQAYVFYAKGSRVTQGTPFYEKGARQGQARDRVEFAKGGEPYEVAAMCRDSAGVFRVELGAYPPASPPPPPPSGGKHIATLHYANYQPAVFEYGRGDYFVSAEWAARQAASELSIPVFAYTSAVTARDEWIQNISRAEAINSGYVLRTSDGTIIEAAGFQPSALCDMGSSAYQQRWLEFVLAQYRDHDGVQGVFIDDVVQSPHIGTGLSTLYPTQPLWRAGMEEFISVVGPELQREGLMVMPNAGAWYPGNPTWDNGASSMDWGGTIAQWATHICIEYAFQTIDGSLTLRGMGPEWFNCWDGWAKVIKAVEDQDAEYVGLSAAPGGDSSTAIYLKASILLWVNRAGSACVFQCESSGGASPFGTKVGADMGAPLGAATLAGQVWTRNFERGSVWVNPWNKTASITLT